MSMKTVHIVPTYYSHYIIRWSSSMK